VTATRQVDNWPDPPTPVDGCVECRHLDEKRQAAVEDRRQTAESDARVLLRRHLREEHKESDDG